MLAQVVDLPAQDAAVEAGDGDPDHARQRQQRLQRPALLVVDEREPVAAGHELLDRVEGGSVELEIGAHDEHDPVGRERRGEALEQERPRDRDVRELAGGEAEADLRDRARGVGLLGRGRAIRALDEQLVGHDLQARVVHRLAGDEDVGFCARGGHRDLPRFIGRQRRRLTSVDARSNTESIIGSVSFPVNVFCWLGWKQPSRTGPSGIGCSTP